MSIDDNQDSLWPHFAPLWNDLGAMAPGILLAGGYGLFLKQRWLSAASRSVESGSSFTLGTETRDTFSANPGERTVVSFDRWIDQSPRVTKDLDLIAGIDLIASQEQQLRIDAALKKHSFAIVEGNALWQFKKQIDSEKSVLLEFHTPPPETARNDVQYDERRVKPKPSLGKLGIQGRTNPEAIAARLHPFAFSLHGLEIVIPNAVTLAIMMLTAAADRRQHSQNPEKSAEARQFAGSQAEKHANDVWRVIAMATRNESDHATEILNSIRTTSVYARASTSYRELFGEDNAWGATVATGSWRGEDFRVIRTVIESWFR